MKSYLELSLDEIETEYVLQQNKYDSLKDENLNLDMSRGKPSPEQLDLSLSLLDCINSSSSCTSEDGSDCRNYGILPGITEARNLIAPLLGDTPENTLVLGNSSLTIEFALLSMYMNFGTLNHKPWGYQQPIKCICPVPGYDRHFTMTEKYGIEMIPVDLLTDGPDMDKVETLVANDESIKFIWCVPQYSNPSGITYSDETVDRLAHMQCAAPDFRILWDNAYSVHHLYDAENQEHVKSIAIACEQAGNLQRYVSFCSTSKITLPGNGIAAVSASQETIKEFEDYLSYSIIGSDKLNMLRHVYFLQDSKHIAKHMLKQAEIIRPKFELVLQVLNSELKDCGIATWSNPKGGYFISFTGLNNTAKRCVELAHNAGVKLTRAGATWPYGLDPHDSNIRIAPTYPSVEELRKALEVFVCSYKLAALETLM